MNNKILARLIAAVMAIAMLGTVSFAASLTSSKEATVLDVTADTDAAYADYAAGAVKTLIAYGTDDVEADPAAEDIIAIVQNDDGATPATFKVDTGKINDKAYVVVRFGGNGEAAEETKIAFASNSGVIEVQDQIIVAEEEGDGVVYRRYDDVAYFAKEVALGAGEKVVNYGFRIQNTAGTGVVNYFTADTELEAGEGGAYSFGVLLVGVDEATRGTLVANSFYTVE